MQTVRSGIMWLAYRALRMKWQLLRPVTPAVRIMLIRDSHVVMVKQTYLPGWHFPGGMVKRGETLAEAAEREATEEVGAILHGSPLLFGVFSNFVEGKSDHIAVFVCEDFELSPSSDRWEIAAVRHFPLRALPPDASSGSQRRVTEYLDGQFGITGCW